MLGGKKGKMKREAARKKCMSREMEDRHQEIRNKKAFYEEYQCAGVLTAEQEAALLAAEAQAQAAGASESEGATEDLTANEKAFLSGYVNAGRVMGTGDKAYDDAQAQNDVIKSLASSKRQNFKARRTISKMKQELVSLQKELMAAQAQNPSSKNEKQNKTKTAAAKAISVEMEKEDRHLEVRNKKAFYEVYRPVGVLTPEQETAFWQAQAESVNQSEAVTTEDLSANEKAFFSGYANAGRVIGTGDKTYDDAQAQDDMIKSLATTKREQFRARRTMTRLKRELTSLQKELTTLHAPDSNLESKKKETKATTGFDLKRSDSVRLKINSKGKTVAELKKEDPRLSVNKIRRLSSCTCK